MAHDPRIQIHRSHESAAFVALIARRGAHRRPIPRLRRMQHPTSIAGRYFARLKRGAVGDLWRLTESALPKLKAAASVAEVARGYKKDAAEDEVDGILDDLRDQYAERWTRENFADLVQPVISDTSKFHAGQLNKILYPVAGVDVVGTLGSEPGLQAMFDAAVKENVALIRSLSSTYFDTIEKTLTREIADGARWESMSQDLEERFGITERHANLIARDQTGKLFGDLNRIRQTDLGISGYYWRTMRDNRVREEHAEREGDEYEWGDPPEDGNPGEPIQCRCYGEPDLRPVMAEARGEDL